MGVNIISTQVLGDIKINYIEKLLYYFLELQLLEMIALDVRVATGVYIQ